MLGLFYEQVCLLFQSVAATTVHVELLFAAA